MSIEIPRRKLNKYKYNIILADIYKDASIGTTIILVLLLISPIIIGIKQLIEPTNLTQKDIIEMTITFAITLTINITTLIFTTNKYVEKYGDILIFEKVYLNAEGANEKILYFAKIMGKEKEALEMLEREISDNDTDRKEPN